MSNMQITIATIVATLVLLPWVVYLSVKLGTFAFYRGRQSFEDYEKRRH